MNKTNKLLQIYSKIPTIECKRLCQDACSVIGMSKHEWNRLTKHNQEPVVMDKDLRCSLLNEKGECKKYELRPAVCRLFGVVEKMRCPYGCLPERFLTDEEGRAILNEINNLSPQSKPRFSHTPVGMLS